MIVIQILQQNIRNIPDAESQSVHLFGYSDGNQVNVPIFDREVAKSMGPIQYTLVKWVDIKLLSSFQSQ